MGAGGRPVSADSPISDAVDNVGASLKSDMTNI